jgi:hypothetical protein
VKNKSNKYLAIFKRFGDVRLKKLNEVIIIYKKNTKITLKIKNDKKIHF